MPIDDGWDWELLYYAATVVLHMPESHFWRCTPRKLNALVRKHEEVNNPSEDDEDGSKSKSKINNGIGYIDQVMGF